MRQKDIVLIGSAALVAAVIALIFSGMVFNPPTERVSVPVIDKIEPTFPDVKNDSDYNSFLNKDALDPTQPVQIGGSQNTSPFSQ